MKPCILASRMLAVLLVVFGWFIAEVSAQDTGCRTGGTALANAYVRLNPITALLFGSLESYIAENSEHFVANGDSIRCAAALSSAFLKSTVQLYDPNDMRRKQEVDVQLGKLGLSPGPQQATPATEAFTMSLRLSRLARVLPAAALGDFGPYWTPTNQTEQAEIIGVQIFQALLQDPIMQTVVAQQEPLLRKFAEIEFQIISQAAKYLANADMAPIKNIR